MNQIKLDELAQLLSIHLYTLGPFCTSTFSLKFLMALLDVHIKEK